MSGGRGKSMRAPRPVSCGLSVLSQDLIESFYSSGAAAKIRAAAVFSLGYLWVNLGVLPTATKMLFQCVFNR